MSTMICIEHPEQIGLVLKAVRKRRIDQPTYLALTPHVAYSLERMGLSSVQPEDYYSEEDIYTLGVQQLDVIDELCDSIDLAVLDSVLEFRKYDLRSGSIGWYELKNMLNSIAVKGFILGRIIGGTDLKEVLFFTTVEEIVPLDLSFVRESVWSRIIPVVCTQAGLRVNVIGMWRKPPDVNFSEHIANNKRFSLLECAGSLVRQLIGDKGFQATRRLWRKLRAFPRRLKTVYSPQCYEVERPLLVTLTEGYSVADVVEEVVRRDLFHVAYVDLAPVAQMMWFHPEKAPDQLQALSLPSNLSADLQSAWRKVRESEAFSKVATVGEIHIGKIVERRLAHFLSTTIPDILRTFLQAQKLLEDYRPAAVLGATILYREKIFFHAARCARIPSIVYQHGSSCGYVMMESVSNFVTFQNDLRWADYIFSNGTGDNAYHNSKCHAGQAQTIAVGSAVLDRLRRPVSESKRQELFTRTGLNPEDPVVFYCPTDIDGNVRIIPFRNRSPGLAFALERTIVGVFREFQEIQFVVKLPPQGRRWPVSPIVDFIRDEKIKNCVVLTESLRNLLPMADVFVTDYPSTSFLEMLTTDRPILVCGYLFPWPFNPSLWHPSILDMWRKRVIYEDDLDRFLDRLRKFLCERRFEPVKSEDEMLRLFGTHLDDGQSVERAVEALIEISQRHSPPINSEGD